jgi:spermidine synthase
VIPWVLLDTATVPGSGDELRLMQRGAEFSIRLGRHDLMNSRMHGSEDALGALACAKVVARARPRILIGGLGMGFTLRAALAAAGAKAQIVVAELVPAVIAWNRGPLAHLSGNSLADARVDIREVDVSTLIHGARGAYDAILLDVDNGPEGLSREENERIYSMAGLAAAKTALRPGGVLATWSAAPHKRFAQRLSSAGFAVEEVIARAGRNGRGARHVIWLATNGGAARAVSK